MLTRRSAIPPHAFRFTVVLGLLAALPSLSLDISVPTLLRLQSEFGASQQVVGLTITVFMLGFAFGQGGAGPLSDRYGRRPVLLGGLLSYTLAAAACAAAPSIEFLIAARLIQGLGAGASAVLAFTIIRDLFDGDLARAKRSYVTVVFGLAPMLAPSVGAALLTVIGWRPIYLVLTLGGTLLLLTVLFGVAESRLDRPRATPHVPVIAAYQAVLSDPEFVGLAAVNALSFGAIFAYIAGSPVVLMGFFGLSAPAYAGFFACTAGALTLGAWYSGRCAARGIGPGRLLWVGLPIATGTAALLAVLLGTRMALPGLLVPVILLNLFCRGLVAPNAQHMALEPLRDNAGTAAAALGVLQILTGAAASLLVTLVLPWAGPIGLAVLMTGLAGSALAIWAWLAVPRLRLGT